jgi:ABC-type phosphate transport system ATPase subunit
MNKRQANKIIHRQECEVYYDQHDVIRPRYKVATLRKAISIVAKSPKTPKLEYLAMVVRHSLKHSSYGDRR